MDRAETIRFDGLYQHHLRLLKLQGKSEKTIDAYARAVRRLKEHFDCCPDQLGLEQWEKYFSDLVESHSWSTIKIDRNGLMFFWKYVLERDWQWVNIVKAPKVCSLPDVLTTAEVERLIGATRNLRYRVFLLTTYSMGLRLSEALALQVGDIDGRRKLVHIRRGKGHKDRFVPLPDLTYQALRALWCKHRNPCWLFPNAAFYFTLLVAFFLFETFKEDVCGGVVPLEAYPTTLCHKVIDVAAKIVRTSRKIILKIAAAAWDFLGFDELWKRCSPPPVFCWT